MKWLVLVFTFYLMSLSAVPCSDLDNSCADPMTEQAVSSEHDHNNDHDDVCSPFCFCACCSVQVAISQARLAEFRQLFEGYIASPIGIRSISFLPSYQNSIWQPPRV